MRKFIIYVREFTFLDTKNIFYLQEIEPLELLLVLVQDTNQQVFI